MLSLKKVYFKFLKSRTFSISIDLLNINPFEVTCILGENGSGKTTILNLIGGHIIPQEGQIFLFDKDITTIVAEERPTSTVFQQIGLFPHLTVQENIEISVEPNSIFRKIPETKLKAEQLINSFRLQEFRKQKPGNLSIGQQQRVAIARALGSSPEILLLDEPTSALDFINIHDLKNTLKKIKEMRSVQFIVIVSHDLPFVLSVADNIKYIKQGRLVFEGKPSEFQLSEWYLN